MEAIINSIIFVWKCVNISVWICTGPVFCFHPEYLLLANIFMNQNLQSMFYSIYDSFECSTMLGNFKYQVSIYQSKNWSLLVRLDIPKHSFRILKSHLIHGLNSYHLSCLLPCLCLWGQISIPPWLQTLFSIIAFCWDL